jgi:ribosomal protein L7/L12
VIRIFVSIDLKQLTLSELEALLKEANAEIAQRSSPLLSEEETALLRTQPIEAIKRYRARVGCSLLDAKDMVDRARLQAGISW